VVDYAALIHPSGLVAVPMPRRKASPDGPPCRCCTRPLETAHQPGWERRPEGHTLLTCRNPACAMNTRTLTADDYDDVDLSKYRAAEAPEYRAALAAWKGGHE
jgi:hypothetical protein